MKRFDEVELRLDKIIGGGQAIGTLGDGRKLLAWGGLPGELVKVQITKKKSSHYEGVVVKAIDPSPERIEPKDSDSYLSTSPWQIMTFEAEQKYKAQLIKDAFSLSGMRPPETIEVYSDGRQFHYRNKAEFSWYGDDVDGHETLDLAFFRRGSKGKVVIDDCALLPPEMMRLAHAIRKFLHSSGVSARQLKTLLVRCDAGKNCVWQLYVKDPDFMSRFNLDVNEAADKMAQGGEIIYSDPKSPASVITKRLASFGDLVLRDSLLGIPFRYATEGFFQVNLPVYEEALRDIKTWVDIDFFIKSSSPTPEPNNISITDLYAGVGSIGLTLGEPNTTLVEINEHAVREMKRNIKELGLKATPVLAASQQALEYISAEKIIIVDPPRAGLHSGVINKLLEVKPRRIIYLSCNPITQARDIALLKNTYQVKASKAYNFFPRTPHIENLVLLTPL